MLKLPFIERTAVGIEITGEVLRWVEVNKLGNRISYKSSGEFPHNNSDASIGEVIQGVKESIVAEAYQIGLSIPEALLEIIVEDLPFMEEQEDIDAWIAQKLTTIEQSFVDTEIEVQYQIIEIDEDSKRGIFQIVNAALIERFKYLFAEVQCFPVSISTGVFETGYTQLFNPAFIEGFSGVLSKNTSKNFLSIFNQGLPQNVIELPISESSEWLVNGDSYLQSVELSQELPRNSVPLFSIGKSNPGISNTQIERSIFDVEILKGRKGFSELPSKFSIAAGATIKLFYQDLDVFNFSSESSITSAILTHDKQECIRLGILLFVPLILIGLLGFGYTKVLDYKLIESNQIMNQVGGQLEEISNQRDDLFELRDRFLEVKSIIEKNQNVAPVFELVENTIPEEVWIQEMQLQSYSTEQRITITVSGETSYERSITDFINTLSEHDQVEDVELLISQKKEEIRNTRTSINQPAQDLTEFQLLIQIQTRS